VSGDLLDVELVTRSFAIGGLLGRGHFNAVNDVSFTVRAGRPEILAIIGESGSGETTLAGMILNRGPDSSAASLFDPVEGVGSLAGRRRPGPLGA